MTRPCLVREVILHKIFLRILLLALSGWLSLGSAGCSSLQDLPRDERTGQADRQVRERWGKSLFELPTVKLVAISPHNEDIQREFEWAFCLHHAIEHGQRVTIEWRDVGGGSTSIEAYLLNVYRRAESADIDLIWGGGEFTFRRLADEGILQKLELSEDVFEQVPQSFGGVDMRDAQGRWIGSAVSGFGFIYNARLLDKSGIAPPRTWDDLADPRFADLIALADPNQSGSAAAAYLTIVQSAPSWPQGWAKLLGILANAKRFNDSAGAAANAPEVGEALVAACIDFFGLIRSAQAPDELVYISPRGQTPFTPDPIGILKNPPNPELARRFVQFVMSPKGQALWAVQTGRPDGPIRNSLGRQPIRRDVYEIYSQDLLASIVDPYEQGQALELREWNRQINFSVLRLLVGAAAIDNRDGLRKARNALGEKGFPHELMREFHHLPPNVATIEAMTLTAKELADPTSREIIMTDWQRFFREKYARIAG